MIIFYVTIIEQSTAEKWLRYCFSLQKLKKSSILFCYFFSITLFNCLQTLNTNSKEYGTSSMESKTVSISIEGQFLVLKTMPTDALRHAWLCFLCRDSYSTINQVSSHTYFLFQLPRDRGAQLHNQVRCYLLLVSCLCHDIDCLLKLLFSWSWF